MQRDFLGEESLLRLLALIKNELSKYVKSEQGKGLSANDFTTELLNKLNSIDPNAIGRPGEPGYTPQKGIDYYTEEDKAELVQTVQDEAVGDLEESLDYIIAIQEELMLPDGDEVSY